MFWIILALLLSLLFLPPTNAQYPQYPPQPQYLQTTCTTDYDCLRFTGNSKCYNSRCVCALGYQATSNRCTRKYCYNNYDCTALFSNTRCNTDRTCICDYNFYLNSDSQTCTGNSLYPNPAQPQYPNQYPNQYPQYPNTGLQYRCTYDQDCIRYLVNARCSANQCVCTNGYQLINGRCEQLRCTYASDCSRFSGYTCNYVSGTCECDSSHRFDYSTNTCVPIYGYWSRAKEVVLSLGLVAGCVLVKIFI